ncbi:hypothetical protein [Martelella alba]|nr:hypothetical protein [Martelella alba]
MSKLTRTAECGITCVVLHDRRRMPQRFSAFFTGSSQGRLF